MLKKKGVESILVSNNSDRLDYDAVKYDGWAKDYEVMIDFLKKTMPVGVE